MTNVEMEKLKIFLESKANKISNMTSKEKSEYIDDMKVRHRLINAEIKDLEVDIAKIDRMRRPGTDECNKRTGKILSGAAIASALALGGVCAIAGEPVPGDQVMSAIVGGFTGGIVGGIMLGSVASIVDDAYLLHRRNVLEKKQYKLKHELFKDEYVVSRVDGLDELEEEMGE